MGENTPVVVPTKVTQNKIKRLNKKEKNLKRHFSRISEKNKNIRKELERDVTKTQTELNKITGKSTDEPKTLLDADIQQEEILRQPLQPTKYQEIKKLLYGGRKRWMIGNNGNPNKIQKLLIRPLTISKNVQIGYT